MPSQKPALIVYDYQYRVISAGSKIATDGAFEPALMTISVAVSDVIQLFLLTEDLELWFLPFEESGNELHGLGEGTTSEQHHLKIWYHRTLE